MEYFIIWWLGSIFLQSMLWPHVLKSHSLVRNKDSFPWAFLSQDLCAWHCSRDLGYTRQKSLPVGSCCIISWGLISFWLKIITSTAKRGAAFWPNSWKSKSHSVVNGTVCWAVPGYTCFMTDFVIHKHKCSLFVIEPWLSLWAFKPISLDSYPTSQQWPWPSYLPSCCLSTSMFQRGG